MPTTVTSHVGEQLGWEQLVAVVGEEGVHRSRWDQVTTPARRVQLVIGWVACGRHAGQSARWQPTARTTRTTRPTRSTEPRPFSRLLEGRVLDLIRTLNDLRKVAGLELTDRIRVTLPEWEADLLPHAHWIKDEVLAVALDTDASAIEPKIVKA
jgi:hypothetical protein